MSVARAFFAKASWRRLARCMVTLPFLMVPAYAVDIESWQLGGAKVLFVHAPELPIIDINLAIKVGSIADPKGKEGVSAFTRSQLLLGNRNWDEQKLSNHMADYGARVSSSGGMDGNAFRLRLLSDEATQNAVLPAWLDIIGNPHFEAKRLNRERERAISDHLESLTQPGTVASRTFFSRVYGDHPYAKSVDEKSFKAINVRDLESFYKTHYHQDNAIVSLVGAITRAQAEKLSARIIDALPKSPDIKAKMPTHLPAKLIAERVDIPFESEQAHIYVGLPFIDVHDPDLFPLSVGNYILGGGGFESRLMKIVRVEHGLAYSVSSSFSPMRDAGAWWMRVQTRNEQAEKTIALLEKTVEDFLEHGPTDEELSRAKAYKINSFPLSLDSNSKILGRVAAIGLYDLPLDYLDTRNDRFAKVEREAVLRAFRKKMRAGKWLTVVVGAPEKKEKE